MIPYSLVVSSRTPRLLVAVSAVQLVPDLAMACSGPGAAQAIASSERMGWLLWGVAIAIALAFSTLPRLRSRGWKWRWPLLLIAAVHPGWWMSARGGDCGFVLRAGSILVAALMLVVGGALYWAAGRNRRRA